MFGNKVGHLGRVGSLTLAQRVSAMFSRGEPGAWYDPSDMSTLFQDSAGTTPVTAVEQPVGRMLDKSGRGNHATQATTTKRPVLSRRVNLLVKTEQFDDGVWVKSGLGTGSAPSVTSNTATAPDGTLTASQVNLAIGGGTNSSDWSWLYQNISRTAGESASFTIWIKAATPADIGRVVILTGFDSDTVRLSAEWEMHELPDLPVVAGTFSYGVRLRGDETPGAGTVSFHVWGASLTRTTDAHLPYQWVNTATDYDADPSKFPAYLRFDGVDDALQTGSINFTSTDKMTVWAGITKLSEALQLLVELSATANTNNGAFKVLAADPPGTEIAASSRGTAANALNQVSEMSAASPGSFVLSSASDIAGDLVALRVNSIAAPQAVGDQGAGNYGNYPLYIGARAGTSLFFNGRIYSLIVRGAQSSLSQIEATELYIKQKMRMP